MGLTLACFSELLIGIIALIFGVPTLFAGLHGIKPRGIFRTFLCAIGGVYIAIGAFSTILGFIDCIAIGIA